MSDTKETKWIEFVSDGTEERNNYQILEYWTGNFWEGCAPPKGTYYLTRTTYYRYPAPEEPSTESAPQEIGGTHYQEGVKVSPWDLEKVMETSGSAFVDSRRSDVIEYAFRKKGEPSDMIQDLRKAAHCATVAADFMEAEAKEEGK